MFMLCIPRSPIATYSTQLCSIFIIDGAHHVSVPIYCMMCRHRDGEQICQTGRQVHPFAALLSIILIISGELRSRRGNVVTCYISCSNVLRVRLNEAMNVLIPPGPWIQAHRLAGVRKR